MHCILSILVALALYEQTSLQRTAITNDGTYVRYFAMSFVMHFRMYLGAVLLRKS